MLEETTSQKQKSPRPELPELYRMLSELIENPTEFFDSLIQVETKNNNLTVMAWHIPDPVISLRDIPNPISQTGTDSFPATIEENQPACPPACPMELCLTPINPKKVNSWEVNSWEVKTKEILAQHFEAALIQRTKEILGHGLSQQWEKPEGIKELLTAAKCVFYASDIEFTHRVSGSFSILSESLEDYIETLDEHLHREMQKKLNPQVINLLNQSAPSRGFKPSRKETADEIDPKIIHIMIPKMGMTSITIGQYNKAALVLSCSNETRSANAGTIPFILAQQTSHQGVSHQGVSHQGVSHQGVSHQGVSHQGVSHQGVSHQGVSHQGEFIGRERAQAIQHGMTAHGWKKMTHMDPNFTLSIIHYSNDLEEAAGIINWLAHQGQNIQERSLSQMMQHADIREKLSRPPKNLGDLNMGRVAALAITREENHVQSVQQEQETRHQVADAAAYAQRMTLDGTKVTAATWGGMLKAVHQWHERMNREQTRQQWTDIVNNNGGEIRRWEPALGQFKHQDVTAAELTDETMLLHEALEMNHCVHMYGSRAQQGTVRIFSLTQESGGRATASIILRNGLWQQEQTRGKRNHPTMDAMRECTLALAQACNQG